MSATTNTTTISRRNWFSAAAAMGSLAPAAVVTACSGAGQAGVGSGPKADLKGVTVDYGNAHW